MNKYRNRKTIVDGINFDSKAEANRYIELRMLEKAGYIKQLKLQPKFELQAKYTNNKGEHVRAITYIADFIYTELIVGDGGIGKVVVEDVKGMETKEFKLKKKMFEYKFPDIDFRLVK